MRNDIISDEEMIDMFGEGGAEEVEEYYSGSDLAHEAEQEIAKDNTLAALSRYGDK